MTVLEFEGIFTGYKGTRYEITENRNAQCRFDLHCAFSFLFCGQFLSQLHADSHALDESCSLVVSAEGADGIEDLIHLLEGHAVHLLVEGFEILFQLGVVHLI